MTIVSSVSTKASTFWRLLRSRGLGAATRHTGGYVRSLPVKPRPNPYQALRRGRLAQAIGLSTEIILDTNVYNSYLQHRHGEEVLLDVHDYQMVVNVSEPGLHTDLIAYGEREVHSSAQYRSELAAISATANRPVTVLEVGGHIGYFALMAASVLGEAADIHGFEPSPENFERLQDNIALNGFEDRFTLSRMAVADTTGEATLEIGQFSNQNYLVGEGVHAHAEETRGERIPVDQVSLDEYIREQGIAPEAVDVIRMDVQGAEYEILEGARSILGADDSLLIFMETHPNYVPAEKQRQLTSWLSEAGLQPVYSAAGFRTPDKWPDRRVEEIGDLIDTNAEVLLKR